ncbi:MAG: prepilin-type N-terminal cleavage/methylation domain-containing protein [Gemmatirosa sp.]
MAGPRARPCGSPHGATARPASAEVRLPRPGPVPILARANRPARRGVTLLELLVVLLLLGLAAALAAPRLLRPRAADAGDPLARTVAMGRALALRRAEALRLEIDADGRWRLVARDSVLQRGALPTATTPLRLGISPLGVCMPEPADDAPAPAWDAAACAPDARGGGA